MLHLMNLELKKIEYEKYILVAVIIFICLCLFSTIAIFASKQDNRNTYINILQMVNAGIIESFLVFSSVLMAKIVIEEYEKNTIMIMFSYPIKKEKIILAKLLLISLITIVCIVVANILCLVYLIFVDMIYEFIGGDFNLNIFNYWILQLLNGVIAGGIFSLFPFFIGIKTKSISATVVSSLFLVILVQVILSQTTSFLESFLSILLCSVIAIVLCIYTIKIKIKVID